MLGLLTLAATVTVSPGNTLSGIASHHHRTWEQLYYANRHEIKNPNLIYPGERLVIPGPHSPSLSWHGNSDPAKLPYAGISRHVVYHAAVDPGGTYHGTTSMQQCIISRESRGQAQIWNASGHYGLYQFSYSTWVGSGGAPSLFGHASAAYQTQVFWQAVAARGYSDWAPYDGC